jgi:tripartite-type tricarboxylate transporter receptor subunit TctC
VAPAGIPAATMDKLSKALNKILSQPDFKARIAEKGLEGRIMEPPEFARYIEHEVARWKDVVARSGIKVE